MMFREVNIQERNPGQSQLHIENVGSVERPLIWKKLVERIRIAISDQNVFAECTGGGLSRLAANFETFEDDSFTIKTKELPMATITAYFVGKRSVKIDYSYRKSDFSDDYLWNEYLEFRVDAVDNVSLHHKEQPITIEEAALLILRPAKRDPSFSPPKPQDAPD